MRHLDDGQIAELIDGRPDGRTGGRADRAVEEHLAQCAVCRERVEEARAIADEARAILGSAGPAARAVPPFEEILHRAGRGRRAVRGIPPAWRRLAVAATVVLAGGVGWYARGALMRTTTQPSAAPATDQVAPTVAAVEPTQPAEVGATSPAPPASPAARPSEAKRDAPVLVGGTRGKVVAELDQAKSAEETSAAGIAADRSAVAPEREVARREGLAAVSAPPEAGARALPQAPSPQAANELQLQKVAVPPDWIPATREDAARALGSPLLLLQDVPVTAVYLSAAGDAVRTRQELGGGVTLELIQYAAGKKTERDEIARQDAVIGAVAAEGRAHAVAAIAVDTVTVSGVRVVGRAAVSRDSLRVLLGKVR